MVPLAVGHTHRGSHPNLGHRVPGGEHKFHSLALNGERDKIVLAIKSAVVEEETGMFDGGEFKLDVEFEPLSERWKGEEGSVTEASGLQFAEIVVERTLRAILAYKASLDERSTRGWCGADVRLTRVRQETQLAVLSRVVLVADAGVAALLGDTGALVLARVGVAHVHLDVTSVVVLLPGEAYGTLA